jgi:hypothetical protein
MAGSVELLRQAGRQAAVVRRVVLAEHSNIARFEIGQNQWYGFYREPRCFPVTCGVKRKVTPPLIVAPAPLSSVVAIVRPSAP